MKWFKYIFTSYVKEMVHMYVWFFFTIWVSSTGYTLQPSEGAKQPCVVLLQWVRLTEFLGKDIQGQQCASNIFSVTDVQRL